MSRTAVGLNQFSRPRATVALLTLGVALVVFVRWWGASVTARYPGAAVTALGFFGDWMPEVSNGLWLAAGFALVLTITLPGRLETLSTQLTALVGTCVSGIWMTLLAYSDGKPGLVDAIEVKAGYRTTLPLITSGSEFVSTFTERVADYTIHVKGHPPLFPLLLFWAEQLGFDSALAEAVALIIIGSTTTAALIGIVALLTDGVTARTYAPLLAVSPALVFTAVSPDALIAAVVCWTTFAAVLLYKGSGRTALVAGVACGLGAGAAMYFTYGAPLMLLAPVALTLASRNAKRIAVTGAAALVVAGVVTLAGFWWLDGLELVREFYDEGIASQRPFWFFVIANLVVAMICVGPAVVAGFINLERSAIWWVCGAGLIGLLIADLSGLSKAEVERIWLPFYALMTTAVIGLPSSRRSIRFWMACQLLVGFVLEAGIVGTW